MGWSASVPILQDGRMTRDLGSMSWPMRTARLSIRRATEDDLEATWEFRRLPEVSEWLTRLPTTWTPTASSTSTPNAWPRP